MLSLGVAYSLDQPTVAICTPWHPFKLAAAAAKAARMADALARMLGSGPSDVRTFSRNVARTMNDGWHPAITLFQASPCPRLLAETDSFADFGLMEAPTADQGAADAFDGYSEQAARELLTQADEYLELQPHERANFSIVLYNADNRSLPSHLADSLASKIEIEKDLRCDLILTHSDQRRLRQIYAEQNVAISARLDGVLANEATQGLAIMHLTIPTKVGRLRHEQRTQSYPERKERQRRAYAHDDHAAVLDRGSCAGLF